MFFIVAASATAVSAGLLAWSWADTASASDDYKAAPTQEGFDDGRARVRRTAIFGAATGAFAIATVVLALTSDFASDESDDIAIAPIAGQSEVGLMLSGSLGR